MSKQTKPDTHNKVAVSVSLDRELLAISGEILINRSEPAQVGILAKVRERIKMLNPELQAEYNDRLKHLA